MFSTRDTCHVCTSYSSYDTRRYVMFSFYLSPDYLGTLFRFYFSSFSVLSSLYTSLFFRRPPPPPPPHLPFSPPPLPPLYPPLPSLSYFSRHFSRHFSSGQNHDVVEAMRSMRSMRALFFDLSTPSRLFF